MNAPDTNATGMSPPLAGSAPRRTDFTELVPELDAGIFSQQVGVALSEAAAGCVHTGKQASVTLTFQLKQIGSSSSVECNHRIKYDVPTPKGKKSEERTTSTPLHVGPNGRLTIYPESQPGLPLEAKEPRRG